MTPLKNTLSASSLRQSHRGSFSFEGPNGRTIHFDNRSPLVLIAGLNVLEDPGLTGEVAAELKRVTTALELPLVFKASFDKANRSSHQSPTGPGLEIGLRQLQEIKSIYGLPVITDIHEPAQAAPVAEVADILQIPAFLCRQRELIHAAATTGRPLAPHGGGAVP